MIGETISLWILALPVWGTVTWLLGLGLLYATGISLSHRGSRWWMGISLIGVLMSSSCINAYMYGAGVEGVVTIVPVLVAATLIIAMVAWGSPQIARSEE